MLCHRRRVCRLQLHLRRWTCTMHDTPSLFVKLRTARNEKKHRKNSGKFIRAKWLIITFLRLIIMIKIFKLLLLVILLRCDVCTVSVFVFFIFAFSIFRFCIDKITYTVWVCFDCEFSSTVNSTASGQLISFYYFSVWISSLHSFTFSSFSSLLCCAAAQFN